LVKALINDFGANVNVLGHGADIEQARA